MSLKLQRYWDGQVRDMTQHRITLPFLSGGLRSCMKYFYMSNNNRQEEEVGGFPLRKMKFRVVLTEEVKRQKGKQLVKFP